MKSMIKSAVVAILTAEAKLLLRRAKPTIIAVTGSVGKTSTKDAIFAAIVNHKRTRKSAKSYNSEIGVPLSVLGLPNAWNNPLAWLKNIIEGGVIALFGRNYPEVLVLEAGVDRPGDMAKLAKWLKPDIVVMTRLPDVPVHVEYFASPEAVVNEKLELLKSLAADGAFIYNHDDSALQEVAHGVRQKSVGFSRIVPSDFTAKADVVMYQDNIPNGLQFYIEHGEERVNFKMEGVIGMPVTYTATAAAAVANELGIPLSAVATDLASFVPPPGRMRLISGIKNTLVIDDTYNSSPTALESALLTLKDLRGFQRKIVVAGDMLELGQFSSREHERIGELAASCCDVLFTVGVRARKIAEGALENGLSEKVIFQYDEADRAGKELQNYMQPGDVVLVKASQGMRAERIVEEIMGDPDRSGELLVRQSEMWLKR